MESVERQTGRRPADLDGQECPSDAQHIWAWFVQLSSARGSNGFGANPISFPDILAWRDLTETIIRPSEVNALLMLDHEFMLSMAEKTK